MRTSLWVFRYCLALAIFGGTGLGVSLAHADIVLGNGGSAVTESDDPPTVRHTSPSLDRSRCSRPLPAFPNNVTLVQDTAAVKLAYRVDKKGQVTSIRVVNSSGLELLDQSAAAWVATCRFNPAMNNGVPEAVWTTQEVRFHPRVRALNGTAQCFESYPPYPLESRRYRERGTVVIRYQVDLSGIAENIEVAKSSGYAHLDASATEWISGCRFGPDALQDASGDGWKTQKFSFALR
jgi:TonB family protein